jgi:hypothetical protein
MNAPTMTGQVAILQSKRQIFAQKMSGCGLKKRSLAAQSAEIWDHLA